MISRAKILVVRQALRSLDSLPTEQRVTLLLGIAMILDGELAERAKFIAFLLRETEARSVKGAQ